MWTVEVTLSGMTIVMTVFYQAGFGGENATAQLQTAINDYDGVVTEEDCGTFDNPLAQYTDNDTDWY